MSLSSEKTFSIRTLGCKLNQYESECMRQRIEKSGLRYRTPDSRTDFCIINTCTVTGKTDARCRNAIRRARRLSPDSVIIVTGCQVEISGNRLKRMKEVDYIIENSGKGKIDLLIAELAAGRTRVAESMDSRLRNYREPDRFPIDRFSNHARAFIEIQNGCNAFCSYCIIPFARGRNRSIPPESVITQIRNLVRGGYQEVILTGIHIGRYGEGEGFNIDLAGLLKMILEQTERIRIRLSSIEPNEIELELVELAASTERIASHFHIPLQSGDDSILEKMNRRYRTSQYRKKIEMISGNIKDVCIGTDMIVGFPGEKKLNFEKSAEFLESLPQIKYYHVFSYSDRPGTRASEMRGKINPAEKKRRSRTLIESGKKRRLEFLKSQPGNNRLAVILEESGEKPGFFKSITGNYCNVEVKAEPGLIRKLVPVRVERFENGRLTGKVRGRPYFEAGKNES